MRGLTPERTALLERATANAAVGGRMAAKAMRDGASHGISSCRIELNPGDGTRYPIVLAAPTGTLVIVDDSMDIKHGGMWTVVLLHGNGQAYEWPCLAVDGSYCADKWGGRHGAAWTGEILSAFLTAFADAWNTKTVPV